MSKFLYTCRGYYDVVLNYVMHKTHTLQSPENPYSYRINNILCIRFYVITFKRNSNKTKPNFALRHMFLNYELGATTAKATYLNDTHIFLIFQLMCDCFKGIYEIEKQARSAITTSTCKIIFSDSFSFSYSHSYTCQIYRIDACQEHHQLASVNNYGSTLL